MSVQMWIAWESSLDDSASLHLGWGLGFCCLNIKASRAWPGKMMGHPWEWLTGPKVHRVLLVELQWILVLCGFYKVAEYWISKYWTIDAEGNTELGLREPLVTAFLPTNQYTILFYMCFFFFWLPWWLSGKEFACQCRSHRKCGFDPCVGKVPWRRTWQHTPVFLPGKCHRQRSLVGYSPWGHKESVMTKVFEHKCVFTGTSLNIYYWFISIKFLSHTMTHLWMKLVQHLCFLCELCHNLLAVRDTSHRQCYAWRPS